MKRKLIKKLLRLIEQCIYNMRKLFENWRDYLSEDNVIDLAEHRAIREVQEILGVDTERPSCFFIP
jgi:hypothetical protein